MTGQAGVDVNQFTGKNPPGGPLPAVWQLRQGFHAFGWDGVRAPVEFDNGFHIRSLIRVGANFFFRTEHRFPGASLVAPLNPYAAVNPLITFTGIAGAANTPAAAGGIAADGVATGNATVVSSVAGRTVIWSIVSGPIAVPNTPIAVATPAVVQAGLVAGNFPVKVVDQAFGEPRGHGQHPHRPGTPQRAGRGAPLAGCCRNALPEPHAQRCSRRSYGDLDRGRGRRSSRRDGRRSRRSRAGGHHRGGSPGPPPSPARLPSPPRTACLRTRARSCECSSCDSGPGPPGFGELR